MFQITAVVQSYTTNNDKYREICNYKSISLQTEASETRQLDGISEKKTSETNEQMFEY